MPYPRKSFVRLSITLCLCLAGTLSTSQITLAQTITAEQVKEFIKQCETKRDQYDFRAALPLCLNAVTAAEKLGNPNYLSVIYTDLGNVYDDLGDYLKAIEFYNKALQIDIQIGDKKGEGQDYGSLGIAYYSLGDYPKALEFYNKALQIALQIGDKQGEGTAYGNLGSVYYSLGNYPKAIELYTKALQMALLIGNRKGEGAAYGNLGNAYLSLGDYQKAIEFHNKALQIDIQIGDKKREGQVYGNLGSAYYALGDYQKAIDYQNKRLQIALQIGDKQREGQVYGNLGIAYYALGDYQKAIDYHNKALQILQQIGDKYREGQVYGNLGNAYLSLEYQKAIDYQNKRLQIALQIGDKQGEGNAYGNLGNSYLSRGDYSKAIKYLSKGLQVLQQIEDKQGQMVLYGKLGDAHYSLENYNNALESQSNRLQIALLIKDKLEEISTYGKLGEVYKFLGQKDKAEDYFKKALSESQSHGSQHGVSSIYKGLSEIANERGDMQRAIKYQKIIEQNSDANTFENADSRGMSLLFERNYQDAIREFDKAIQIAEKNGDKLQAAEEYIKIGQANEELKNYDIAIVWQQKAITSFSVIGIKQKLYISQSAIARILIAQNQPDLAIFFYKQAVNTIQSTREKNLTLPKELRQSYLASKVSIYRDLADLLLQQDRPFEAQRVLELLKQEEIIDYLRSATVRNAGNTPTTIPLSPEQLKISQDYIQLQGKETDIYKQRDHISAQINLIPPSEQTDNNLNYKQLSQKLDSFTHQLETFAKEFRLVFIPRSAAALKQAKINRPPEQLEGDFKRLSKQLNDTRAAVIYPLILGDRLELVFLSPNFTPIHRTVNVTKKQLDTLTLKVSVDLKKPGAASNADLQQLYTWLVQPLLPEIEKLRQENQIDTLVFAPDGALRLIPMAALYDGQKYLIERYPLATVTGLSLTNLTSSNTSRQLVAMGLSQSQDGLPALPGVATELKVLADLFKTSPYLNERFTRTALNQTLAQRPTWLHLASHAIFEGDESKSYIQLWNGKLTLKEFKDLNLLGVSLLTLSACETAKGDEKAGLGLSGVAESSGVMTVLGSLWSVNDTSTEQLMESFYKNLGNPKQGNTKSKALQQAQLALIHPQSSITADQTDRTGGIIPLPTGKAAKSTATDFSDPFYWAPFILIGNWR